MTTKVTISINGPRPVRVSVSDGPDKLVQPGTGIEVQIHGAMGISIHEVCDHGGATTQGSGGTGEENPGP